MLLLFSPSRTVDFLPDDAVRFPHLAIDVVLNPQVSPVYHRLCESDWCFICPRPSTILFVSPVPPLLEFDYGCGPPLELSA